MGKKSTRLGWKKGAIKRDSENGRGRGWEMEENGPHCRAGGVWGKVNKRGEMASYQEKNDKLTHRPRKI